MIDLPRVQDGGRKLLGSEGHPAKAGAQGQGLQRGL